MPLYFLLINLLLLPLFSCSASDTLLWNTAEIEETLMPSNVIHSEPMSTFLERRGKIVNYTSDVHLVGFRRDIQAVFKTLGTKCQKEMNETYGEVVAYQAGKMLGFSHVPPTVLTKIDGRPGSLQYYVDSDIDPQAGDNYKTTFTEVDPEELQNLKIFCFLFGQWDAGPTNVIIKKHNG
jgi:hypothetical protein